MEFKVSVIIPHREGESIEDTLLALYLSDYPKENIEIFQAEGTHPTKQRNACVKEAQGEILYFIDNDSVVESSNIKIATDIFKKDSSVAIVGGPAMHITNTHIEEYIDTCLSSFFAVGPISNRYCRKNLNVREGTDKDVILCNLFIKRTIMIEAGLFNENLYPNEENALIDKILQLKYKLIYHPDIIVKRPPRSSMLSYIKMLLNYGRGRLEQTVREFNIKNIIFTIPSFFTLYILSLPIMAIMAVKTQNKYLYLYFLPVIVYIVINNIFAFITAMKTNHKLKGIIVYPYMFFITHFFYGLGFFYGIIRILSGKKRTSKFSIKKYKSFNGK